MVKQFIYHSVPSSQSAEIIHLNFSILTLYIKIYKDRMTFLMQGAGRFFFSILKDLTNSKQLPNTYKARVPFNLGFNLVPIKIKLISSINIVRVVQLQTK